MKRLGLVLFVVTMAVVIGYTDMGYTQETIEILTYYPAPYGIYQDLTATDQVWIGTDADGNPFSGGNALLQVGAITIGDINIFSHSETGTGIHGESMTGYGISGFSGGSPPNAAGVYGQSATSFAGYFDGDIRTTGNISGVGDTTISTTSGGIILDPGSGNTLTYGSIIGRTAGADPPVDNYIIGSDGTAQFMGNLSVGEDPPPLSDNGLSVEGVSRFSQALNANGGLGVIGNVVVTGDYMRVSGYIMAGSNPNRDSLGWQPGHNWFDIAELIPCSKDVEAGDIVVINQDKNREAVRCIEENDTAVAGIISETPVFRLGNREEARQKEPEKNWNFIALAGQVVCKVDASYGEIERGDLLTTSSTPGHAMKAKPIGEINGHPIYPQGCIVGKALEPLEDGKGKILVLVCLM